MAILAPKKPSTPITHPRLQTHKEDLSLKNLSDEAVAGHIYSKHRDDDTIKIDVDNYISFLQSVFSNVQQINEASSQVIYNLFVVKKIQFFLFIYLICFVFKIIQMTNYLYTFILLFIVGT